MNPQDGKFCSSWQILTDHAALLPPQPKKPVEIAGGGCDDHDEAIESNNSVSVLTDDNVLTTRKVVEVPLVDSGLGRQSQSAESA